jgi:hypothetical protein
VWTTNQRQKQRRVDNKPDAETKTCGQQTRGRNKDVWTTNQRQKQRRVDNKPEAETKTWDCQFAKLQALRGDRGI